jgi:hypothetical protein
MKLLLVLLVGFFGSSAQALILEPYGGYQRLSFSSEAKTGGTSSGTSAGLGVGGRIAYDFLGLYAGADVFYAATTVESSGSSSNPGTHLVPYLLVGYSIPVLPLKAWAGYSPMNTFTIKNSAETTYTGSALKVGFGYSVIPLVAVNFEYQIHTFDKFKSSGVEGSVSSVFSKFETTGYFLGASVTF